MGWLIGMIVGAMMGLIVAGMLTSGKTEDLYREIARLKEELNRT
tara:strand:- start:81 stop:212 length:132 start_codon:yes stop_codon:yes gene_type:complete